MRMHSPTFRSRRGQSSRGLPEIRREVVHVGSSRLVLPEDDRPAEASPVNRAVEPESQTWRLQVTHQLPLSERQQFRSRVIACWRSSSAPF